MSKAPDQQSSVTTKLDALWAHEEFNSWKSAASSGSNIFTYGFVSSMPDPKKGSKVPVSQTLLLILLTVVALVIQIVIPIVLSISLLTENDQQVCPAQANATTKLIGVALCLYFVTLTLGMCLSKLRGMGFLFLFITQDHNGNDIPLFWDRIFLILGIMSNVIAMAAAGVAQYLLFIKNAEAENLLVFLLQSLALQFVLAADQRLMNEFWTGRVKTCVGALISKFEENDKQVLVVVAGDEEEAAAAPNNSTTADDTVPDGGSGVIMDPPPSQEDTEGSVSLSSTTIQKVKLLYRSESAFLVMVGVVGMLWTATLGYCM